MPKNPLRSRFAVRLGLGFAVLAMILYGASAATLARLERSEALRASLAAAVRDDLGLALESNELELDLVPPRVRLRSAVFQLPGAAELHFDRVALNLALMPLFRGLADVTQILADGEVTLVLADAGSSGEAVLLLEKRAGAGWRGEISGELATGGSFAADGTVDAAGRFRVALAIEQVEMSPLSDLLLPHAEPRSALAGAFSGTLDVETQPGIAEAGATKAALRLESPQARIRIQDISVDGPVRIEARTDGLDLAHGGSFEVDAGAARVEYAGGMQKASGQGATLRGRADWRAGQLALDDLRLSVTGFQGQVGTLRDSPEDLPERVDER